MVQHLFLSFHVRMMMAIIRREDRPQIEPKGNEHRWDLWYGMLHHIILVSFMEQFERQFIRKIVRNAPFSWSIFDVWIADTLMHFGERCAQNRTMELQSALFAGFYFSAFYSKEIINTVANIFLWLLPLWLGKHTRISTHSQLKPSSFRDSCRSACLGFNWLNFLCHILLAWWCTLHSWSTSTCRSFHKVL